MGDFGQNSYLLCKFLFVVSLLWNQGITSVLGPLSGVGEMILFMLPRVVPGGEVHDHIATLQARGRTGGIAHPEVDVVDT